MKAWRDRTPLCKRWRCFPSGILKAPEVMLAFMLFGSLAGCSEEEHVLVLALRARTQISTLYVQSKQFHDDGSVTLYHTRDFEIPMDEDGYVITVESEPLRLMVDVPQPGRYAVHLVGVPLGVIEADPTGDRLVSTICREVVGSVAVTNVYLGRLTRGQDGLDVDGDTFPEDLDAFCSFQANSEMPCETSCNIPEYSAMLDCNPGNDFEVPEGCGELGEPETWNPFSIDPCGDCLDQDCYRGDAPCADFDEDGYPEDVDCNDRDPAINPSTEEICSNGIDENCTVDIEACVNGDVPCDDDGDGFNAIQEEMPGCGFDCNDSNAEIHPDVYEGLGSNPEAPLERSHCDDGIDNNCNGRIDERCENDLDADGVELEFDCNDCNASIGPGFVEVCGNGVDENCDGDDLSCSPTDLDGDGVDAEPVGGDCEDDDPMSYPGAPDYCGDGIAQNCNLDRECAIDADGDSFDEDDCDDSRAEINPWAVERCDNDGDDLDGLDDDCDGQINEVPWELATTQGCGQEDTEEGWRSIIYSTDVDHCGACRHACDLGATYREGDHCSEGVCQCFELGHGCTGDVTDYCCLDGCQDISVDREHCGSCDNYCAPFGDEECRPLLAGGRGECHCPHEPSQRRCHMPTENACCPDLGCTNVNEDVHNCGGCGIDCEAEGSQGPRGDICAVNAEGVPTCYCGSVGTVCTGTAWCTDVTEPSDQSCGCVDLLSDPNNCSRCEFQCNDNEICDEGACLCSAAEVDCEGGEENSCCPGVDHCVNLLNEEGNCGECGVHCRPGEECVAGQCRCNGNSRCTENQVCCSDSGCTSVLTDEANCGPLWDLSGCGHDCNPGVECSSGSCSCGSGGDCGSNEICCWSSYCANLSTETNNCGDCGEDCFPGEECLGGRCVCGSDCDDENSCTTDACVDDRCAHATVDADDDGYCRQGCRDQDSGETGDCTNGDCDDTNPEANPGTPEDCSTDFDDDCDGWSNDTDAENCNIFYRDEDDDTYGLDDTICRCIPSNHYTATRGDDCDDDEDSINPSQAEICNGVDDDCTDVTLDGVADCLGGAEYCCGSPATCRTCCIDGHCPGENNICKSSGCDCRTDWSDCAGTCDCNTGFNQLCCSGACVTGECCDSDDCGEPTPACNTTTNQCECSGGLICDDSCIPGANCCITADCNAAETCIAYTCEPEIPPG